MSDNPTPSFFHTRLAPLGVTDDNNTMLIENPEAEHPMPRKQQWPIFSEDGDGNIEILYWTLHRQLISWIRTGDGKMSQVNGKPDFYTVKRLREPKGDMKYQMPETKWLKAEGKPSIYPWLSPELVEKWEQKVEINTLFLTEGVFKGWAGCKASMDVVGMSSYTHYSEDHGKALLMDVERLILDCKVKNVVVLWDGDCLNISENALAKREDITKRPAGFYSAAKKIRKLILDLEIPAGQEKPAIWFMHPKTSDIEGQPKGLDDVLVWAKSCNKFDAVVTDAMSLRSQGAFFKKINITDTTNTLKEHFCLNDKDKFYRRHESKIGLQEWKWFGDLVRWNDEDEKVEMIAPKWAEELKWVGNEYFQEIEMPSIGTSTRRELAPRNMATLTKLYGANFWKYLSHFAGFCNVPEHIDYKMVVERGDKKFMNQYFPIKWVPKAGDWSHIKSFMQHLFGTDKVTHELTGQQIERWELGLDYVQQLYLNPTQQLPVLILYSQENQTGKSTFGLLMQQIFGDNLVPIGNSDLQSDFNSTYSSKLLAVCEETLLERKKEAERIKAISTSPRILVNPKGQAQYQIDFFCKFIFTSNNPRMIYVTRHDTRFWILEIKQLKDKVPQFEHVMAMEIPAFLHHLQHRESAAKKEGRMYFHDSLLRTDAFEATVRVNEPTAATDLREKIRDLFTADAKLELIEIPMSELRKHFFTDKTSVGWIGEILRDYLRVGQLLGSDGKAKVKRGTFPEWEINGSGELACKSIPWMGRPYQFFRKDFMQDENLEDYKELEELSKPQGNVPSVPVATPVQEDLPF
jgi:hypothetical protein